MPKKFFTVLSAALLVAALLMTISPVAAITNGVPDGDAHPYVVMIIFDDASGPAWRCTGTLLSPTVVLTAGHCSFEAVTARVWTDNDLTDNAEYPFGGTTSVEGTPIAHPNFNGTLPIPNTSDVGVVILDEPINLPTYGTLAPLGFLDTLATRRGQQNTIFTSVGYGLQSVVPDLQRDPIRYVGTSNLVSLRSKLTDGYNLHLGSDPGKGKGTGGTCNGDSGGPTFYGSTNMVVAVTSFGLNTNCVGADFSYRLDIAYSQNWVLSFL